MIKHDVKFEGSKVVAKASAEVDPNGDGQPVATIEVNLVIDLAEVPDETMSLVLKKRSEKKA